MCTVTSPNIINLVEGILLVLSIQGSNALCQQCVATRLVSFDHLLVSKYEIWSRNVTNKGVCFRLCHIDSRCVTFQHNTETGVCRGMASTFTSPSQVETSSETGNYLYIPCTAGNKYGAACSSGSDCHVTNNDCIDGMCRCQPGLILSKLSHLCVQSYVGCYEDDASRMLPHGVHMDESMTTELCVDYCKRSGHIYAGTQAANWCSCGDVLPAGYNKRGENECDQTCVGNASQICGGDWRSSVYLTPI